MSLNAVNDKHLAVTVNTLCTVCILFTFQLDTTVLQLSRSSIMSVVVDEERMRSGHWLGLVVCVPFSALTLMVGRQEGHPAH